MYLIVARTRGSVKEKTPRVIEDVLAVVARIDHSGCFSGCLKTVYDSCQQRISHEDGVVVGIQEGGSVSPGGFDRSVGSEACDRAGIAVIIVEMRSVGMEHDKEFSPGSVQSLVDIRKQVGVKPTAVRLRGKIADENRSVGLLTEKVDEGAVAVLIGYIGGGESGLTECGNEAFGNIDGIPESVGVEIGEKKGDRLVGGVALRYRLVESHDTLFLRQERISGPSITEELPVVGA